MSTGKLDLLQVSASDSIEDGGARENNLYVKNLPPDVDDARLERMFNVRHVRVSSCYINFLQLQASTFQHCLHVIVQQHLQVSPQGKGPLKHNNHDGHLPSSSRGRYCVERSSQVLLHQHERCWES